MLGKPHESRVTAPASWREVPLREVVEEMGDGGTPPRSEPDYFGGEIPWIVIDDIERHITGTREELTSAGLGACSAKLWPIESIILSTGATIGNVGITKVPAATKQGITGILTDPECLQPQFLAAVLSASAPVLRSFAQGSTIQEIRPPVLGTLQILLPPLLEQKKVAAILSSVDDAIAATRKVIEQTKRVKKGLLQDLMTRGIGHTRFKETEIGKIPEEWQVVRVSDIGDVITGRTPPTKEKCHWNGRTPFVTPGEISHDSFEIAKTERGLTQSGVEASRTIPAGSIMVVCIGATIGKVGVSREKVAFNQQINSVVPEKGETHFLSAAFSRLTPLMREVTGRQAVPLVNKSSFSSLLVPWAPIDEQEQIGQVLEQTEVYMKRNKIEVERLKVLKRGLMQDLLTGRVRTPVD